MKGQFRITHPFHPRCDETFERIDYRRSFGGEMLDARDASGKPIAVPLAYTDAAYEEDPFLAISAGRAYFRIEDLLELAEVLVELQA